MKKLTLNRGKYEILIDDEDYYDVVEAPPYKKGTQTRLNWTVVGCKGKLRVRTGPQNGPFVHLHRYIMCPGEDEGVIFLTDNRLDFQKKNLKVLPLNSVRGKGYRENGNFEKSSQYRGVQKCKQGWSANIGHKGENHYLGFYLEEIHAARAYDIKAKELHSDWPSLNNVPEDIVPVKCKSKKRKNATSKYVGVYRDFFKGVWCGMIRVNKERIFLGTYKVEIHAARAYDIAVIKYRGPDAAHNNIPESVIPIRGKQHKTKKT